MREHEKTNIKSATEKFFAKANYSTSKKIQNSFSESIHEQHTPSIVRKLIMEEF